VAGSAHRGDEEAAPGARRHDHRPRQDVVRRRLSLFQPGGEVEVLVRSELLHVTTADSFGRPLRNLRISVTDRCNLRRSYCMPEEEYRWLPAQDILRFEEIATLVDAFTSLGVDKVRLTGGEPLIRRELPKLVELLAARPAVNDLALTTNAVLLSEQAKALK